MFVFLITTCSLLASDDSSGSDTKILIYTPAKCGTHLICKALVLMTGKQIIDSANYRETSKKEEFINIVEKNSKNNLLTHTHWLPSSTVLNELKNSGYKLISIIRDPRDQLISYVYHLHKYNGYNNLVHPNHPKTNKQLSSIQVKELLKMILVKNTWPYKNSPYEQFYEPTKLQFLDKDFSCVIKFEDLVGEKGGGSLERQIATLNEIKQHLNLNFSDEYVSWISANLFGNTWSFRSGQIGDWTKFFDEPISHGFDKKFGTILLDLKYK